MRPSQQGRDDRVRSLDARAMSRQWDQTTNTDAGNVPSAALSSPDTDSQSRAINEVDCLVYSYLRESNPGVIPLVFPNISDHVYESNSSVDSAKFFYQTLVNSSVTDDAPDSEMIEYADEQESVPVIENMAHTPSPVSESRHYDRKPSSLLLVKQEPNIDPPPPFVLVNEQDNTDDSMDITHENSQEPTHEIAANRIACTICHQIVARSRNCYKAHIASQHLDVPCPCPFADCSFESKTPAHVDKHIIAVHKTKRSDLTGIEKTTLAATVAHFGESVNPLIPTYFHVLPVVAHIRRDPCIKCGGHFPTLQFKIYHIICVHRDESDRLVPCMVHRCSSYIPFEALIPHLVKEHRKTLEELSDAELLFYKRVRTVAHSDVRRLIGRFFPGTTMGE